jgi:hypothetical protein
LLDSVANDVEVVSARKHLLELRDSIFGRNLGSFGFLLEEGIDVKTGERFLGLA